MTIQIKNYQSYDLESSLCPDCKGRIIQIAHEKVCENCGLVFSSLKLCGSYQFNDVSKSEYSAGDQYVSMGKRIDNICNLGSHIGYYSTMNFFDYKNQLIKSTTQKKFKKLKRYYSLPLKIKNHETDYRILKILNDISKNLNLTEIVKQRAAYFYQTIKKRAPKITNHVTLIAFCVFYASREYQQHSPLSIKEMCDLFVKMGHRISPKLIIRDSLQYKGFLNKHNHPHKCEDFIIRFINKVINSTDIQTRMELKGSKWSKDQYRIYLTKTAEKIVHTLKKRKIGSRNPFILASAIVYSSDKYLAKKMDTKSILTQNTAAKAMGIPEYSIRDHYVKVLKPILNL